MVGTDEPLFDPEEWQEPLDAERVERELRALRPRHLIDQLAQGLEWRRLCELIEERGFLAEMAETHGFERPGEDIEKHVLACAIAVEDWERFVRFAALACNLRAIAEDLAAPEILEALTRSGRIPLALDIAARIADPVRRAEARAVIAGTCGPGREPFGSLRRAISEDLQGAGEEAEALARVPSLVRIARLLGPELNALWPSCLSRLAPVSEHPRIRQAVAAAWLDRGDPYSPGLWNALEAIPAPGLLLEIVPEALAALEPDDPQAILDRIGTLFQGQEEVRRLAMAAFLGRLARSRSEIAIASWERWVDNERAPWSPQLVEAGRDVIVRLLPDRFEAFCAGIEDPTARAALRVVALEHRCDHVRAAAALTAVGEIPEGPERLHWSLRYVAARAWEPLREVRNQVGAIAGYLHEMRYEAPAADLRLFLDLVAGCRKEELKAHLENVVWSPASRPDTLLTLARDTGCDRVADLLLENAERYAAAVSPNAAEGFQLRKQLLITAASRLCLLRRSTRDLDRAIERLLPEEEDELRAVVAPQLRSREIAEGIRDRRRRLLTLLAIEEDRDDLLTARSLYRSMARVDVLEDEVRGLSTLLELPLDLSGLAENGVGVIRDPGIRLQALLRLAWHFLAFQESFYAGRPDRAAAIEMVRSAFNADTDSRLVAITPQIAELGAQLGGRRAVAELQEAARRLAHFESVPWPRRLEALERLLAILDRLPEKVASQVRRAFPKGPGFPAAPVPALEVARATLAEADPSSPEHEPLIRELWRRSSPKVLSDLGNAVREALRIGGRQRGETALRLWFHARLAPQLGAARRDRVPWAEGAAAALRQALDLAPGG